MNGAEYDVVIAGGGIVGAALACALGGSCLRVALVEGCAWQPIHPGDEVDLRVSAISRSSQRIFAAVGAWAGMTQWRVSPFREMRVWDSGGTGQIHFDSAVLGEPLLGWIIENRIVQSALLERSREFANVDLYCPAALGLATVGEDNVHLQMQDGRELRTRLLVGADGADSRVRHWAGVSVLGWSYEQKAVVATVSTELPHQETAWQRFLLSGPLAFLPLHDGRSSIVWSTTPAQAEQLLSLDEAAFAVELAEAFEWRLGAVTAVGYRAAFPLRMLHAETYIGPRIALVGDAAHVVHPLAGQGVNLGLLDAAALAEVLLDAASDSKDIAAIKVLRRYERWRKGENLLMLGLLDSCKRLFGSSLPVVRQLRNWGLQLTEGAVPLKNMLARRAMGLAGDLPRLARGPQVIAQ